ncbi:hypothetical protein EV368DRAFT_82983 [Lentinula lateritia]|nr:hypothetical protein EV368DRAFT_82983 [Lentinula lateritia]
MTSSTSAVAPASSSSSFDTDSGNSHRLAITGAVLGVFGIIGVGIILWWTLRMKPKVPYEEEAPSTPVPRSSPHTASGSGVADALRRSLTLNGSLSNDVGRSKSSTLNRNKSLAAKITPFNPDATIEGDGPRFVHTPGTNMRIATRLSNGVWQFSEPVRGALGQFYIGYFGQMHPLAAASQASLLLQTQDRASSPSRPYSPYLTPTSNLSNPFSDANSYAPTRCESPAENPFDSGEISDYERDARRQDTESHVSTTTTSHYPFTRPSALTLRTQAQSMFRGTVYDLQSLSSPGSAVPAGIHDIDEEIMKHRGKPLPVADSELMRRGLRKESSLGATSLLGSASNLSLPTRQDSNDSYHSEPGLGRRPSAASAVLLGGTGPVGTRNLSAMNNGNRSTTYHPDLDDVIDVRGDSDEEREPEMDLADVAEEENFQGAEALPTPVSGGVITGVSPYRMSEAFTSLEGHGLSSPGPSGSDRFPYAVSNHASHPSTSTIATSLYPHTITTKGGSSSLGFGLSNPYASTSTVYLGSLGHLTRPSLDTERETGRNTSHSMRHGRPSLSIEPAVDKRGRRMSRGSTLATTYEGFEGENTLVYESPISPGGSYPYSPTSTSYTHETRAQTKNWQRQSSLLGSESHGYGAGYGIKKAHHYQLGLDDVYAADASMSMSGHDHSREDGDGGDTTIHAVPPSWLIDGVSGVDIMDVPSVPPPTYLSPGSKSRSSSQSMEGRT